MSWPGGCGVCAVYGMGGVCRLFGTVHDVRIPHQQKRMFGFVTFAGAEPVRAILKHGNPHFICGSRVLVKPYRERAKPADRSAAPALPKPRLCPASTLSGPTTLFSPLWANSASRLSLLPWQLTQALTVPFACRYKHTEGPKAAPFESFKHTKGQCPAVAQRDRVALSWLQPMLATPFP